MDLRLVWWPPHGWRGVTSFSLIFPFVAGLQGKVPSAILLPVGLHLCLSHGNYRIFWQVNFVMWAHGSLLKQFSWLNLVAISESFSWSQNKNKNKCFSCRAEEFRKIGCEVVAASTDSHFSHLAWINTPRKQGGLGSMKIPLLADKTCDIAKR